MGKKKKIVNGLLFVRIFEMMIVCIVEYVVIFFGVDVKVEFGMVVFK